MEYDTTWVILGDALSRLLQIDIVEMNMTPHSAAGFKVYLKGVYIYIYMKVFNGICTVYKGLINIQRKHCEWILRKDRLKRILRDICLKNKQLNIRGLLFYYVIMALVRALLVFCVCDCAFIVAHSFQQVKKINKLFSEQFKKPQIVSQLCFPEFLSTFLHSMHIFLFY